MTVRHQTLKNDSERHKFVETPYQLPKKNKNKMLYKLQTAFKTFVNCGANILHKGISDHINISTVDCWPSMGFFWPYLQDHSLLRSRNFATMVMWRNDFSSLLSHWLIGNQNRSVFMISFLNNDIIRVNILLLLLHCN